MSSENGSNSIGISRIPPYVGCSSYIVLSFGPTFVRYIDNQYIFDGIRRFCGDIVIGRPYFYRVSIRFCPYQIVSVTIYDFDTDA